jgi:hypothetical protein
MLSQYHCTTAHVKSHTESSNSSSGHTTVPLELQNSLKQAVFRIYYKPLAQTTHRKRIHCLTADVLLLSHSLAGGGMFSACCIPTSNTQTCREHCFCCCVFFGTCLLGRCLAMNVPRCTLVGTCLLAVA